MSAGNPDRGIADALGWDGVYLPLVIVNSRPVPVVADEEKDK